MEYEKKYTLVSLFYNTSNKSCYIQIGKDVLCMIKASIAAKIAEKEKLTITHVSDIKEMQIKANEV